MNERLQAIENPSQAIVGVEPWQKDVFTILDHPYRQFFSVFSGPEEQARQYLCDPDPGLAQAVEQARRRTDSGSYHATMFRFRFDEQGGTLALVWAKEAGQWKIVAWSTIRQ